MESEAPPGLAGVADPDAEDDDEVIRELDVFLCNGRVDAQLFLLQFPLRPSWRPYELEDCDEMRFKKQARRLEMELPLCSDSDNYDADVEDPKLLIKKITLQSSEVDMSTSYTVGRIASNALYLTPIDAAFHMRPDMRHLDMANPDVKEKEPKEVEEGLTQLQVKVQKRETEAQQQRRLSSYAHLARQEAEEDWHILKSYPKGSMLSNSVLKQLSVPADQDVPMAMDRQAYLSAIAPQIVNTDAQETSPEAGVDGADVIGSDMRIEGEVLEVLHKSLTAMFRKHGVANQVNIRQWLMEFPAAGAASEASQANDQALHEAVTSGGQFVCIRGSYLAARTGSPQTDPFRAVVLDAFGSKDLVKRSELVAEAKKRGLNISEAMFMKVMRAVCLPRPGGFWCLKPGWDGS